MKLSLWEQPAPVVSTTMPLKLKLVIGALLLFIPQELWLSSFSTNTKIAVRIAISVIGAVSLFRGNDLTRALLRGLSAIAVVFGFMTLMQLNGLGLPFASPFMAMLAAALVLYAFIFWALGQEDVKSWMRWRSTPSATPPAIASFGGGRTR